MKHSHRKSRPFFYFCLAAQGLMLAAPTANAQTTIPPDQWSVMQVVATGASGQGAPSLYYPFTGPATNPLSVTCHFRPSSYSPGSYEAGFVDPGYVSLDWGNVHEDGYASFQMNKPYAANWSQAYTQVVLGNYAISGVNLGTYAPGGLYTITFTFNRAASTIQIDVTGPTTCSRTVASSGQPFVRLTFHGSQYCNCGQDGMPDFFGNVSVTVPTPPTPPALTFGGLQRLNGTNVASLTWTNNGAACVLESSASLAGGWSAVSTPCVTNGNWVATQVTNGGAAQFFRLRGL